MGRRVVVGIADCAVCDEPDAVMITYALGSCVAVCVHDPVSRVAGMLHFMLPDSTMDVVRGRANPYVFADTGISRLLEQIRQAGGEPRRLRLKVAGGANVMDACGFFEIGKRNVTSMRKILMTSGLSIDFEDLGGTVFRTVSMEVGNGKVEIRSASLRNQA